MANVIQIKHGTRAPEAKDLSPYELGYATVGSDKYLYIGNPTTSAAPIQLLKVGEVEGLKTQIEGLAPTAVSEFTNVMVNNSATPFGKISAADFITALELAKTSGTKFTGQVEIAKTLVVTGTESIGTNAPTGAGEEGQIYFQIVG